MPSIPSPFGSSMPTSEIPRLPTGGAAQSGGPAVPGAWLRFKASLAESGWLRSAGCRQALLERNSYLLSVAVRETRTVSGETNFRTLFERQVKSVGGFDAKAQPSESRAIRAMTRLIGLARLAGTASYEAQALSVIREAQAEQAAAKLFRESAFHQLLKEKLVNADLVNRFEDDFCRRCASCARGNPSEDVGTIINAQLDLFLPSEAGIAELSKLDRGFPSSAAPVLSAYLVEMRDRMWTLNERNSAKLPGFSPDHQLRRHMLRYVLESAVRDSAQPGNEASVRYAKEHCMSKIDLISNERLDGWTVEKFISRNFYDRLPANWQGDSDSSELSDDDASSTNEDTPVSSRSAATSEDENEDTPVSSRFAAVSEDDASKRLKLEWVRDPETGAPVALLRNGKRMRRFSLPDSGDDSH